MDGMIAQRLFIGYLENCRSPNQFLKLVTRSQNRYFVHFIRSPHGMRMQDEMSLCSTALFVGSLLVIGFVSLLGMVGSIVWKLYPMLLTVSLRVIPWPQACMRQNEHLHIKIWTQRQKYRANVHTVSPHWRTDVRTQGTAKTVGLIN